MTTWHYCLGSQALADYRIRKLLADLKAQVPEINSVQAYSAYFFEVVDGLNDEEEACFLDVFNSDLKLELARRADLYERRKGRYLIAVLPRLDGTSAWSSKATDIAHNTGLEKINRIERGIIYVIDGLDLAKQDEIKHLLHDRMTEKCLFDFDRSYFSIHSFFKNKNPASLKWIYLLNNRREALEQINSEQGLALSTPEIDYLVAFFNALGRNPSDVELMMFAQANSEHCRHKIFNAEWTIDGKPQAHSLFDMIRHTHAKNPGHVLSAYHDNSAVIAGFKGLRFFSDPADHYYRYNDEDLHLLLKVETHNHPTAISPYAGAATGAGGEIRDEAATGRGAKPKAGLCGFAVSNLNITGFEQAWESDNGKPAHIASALDIMLQAPIGAANYSNEFGRPVLAGYFRSYEQRETETLIYGYHKPIMLAGGHGLIRAEHVDKKTLSANVKLIVLGGAGMMIGLGGGAASSMAAGTSDSELDFSLVQQDNAEMERRCQEVIDHCWALGERNPILKIHDVGAGGLANAIPELVSDCGALIDLRAIPNDEPGMSPLAIWCNESQERYVLGVAEKDLEQFEKICARERAPYAIVGETRGDGQLIVWDELYNNKPIDVPLSFLFGNKLKIKRDAVTETKQNNADFDLSAITLNDAIHRVLHLPSVASKHFLITIGDRSVSGLVVRDQMVGPWQVPVADCAVTSASYYDYTGEALALGERSPIAITNAPASGRMAIAEAIMNIAAARILKMDDIVLSANWMAACGERNQNMALYATVAAVRQLCQDLQIAIPVGKDSLSMSTQWQDNGQDKKVIAPLSLNITALARVADVRLSLTPQLQQDPDSLLLFIDLANGKQRLGGSALCQVYGQIVAETPDLDDPMRLSGFFQVLQLLNDAGLILAYHDRSDGGLFVTLAEMAFAGQTGIDIELNNGNDPLPFLLNEELGAVMQIKAEYEQQVRDAFIQAGFDEQAVQHIGSLNQDYILSLKHNGIKVLELPIDALHKKWAATSYQIQSLRDNPDCAKQEYEQFGNRDDPGLFVDVPFKFEHNPLAVFINAQTKPKMAILREQGVNGQLEMAAAFDRAGFDCIDVHMQDLINGRITLEGFKGLVACGGFSYGDVLGAGGGWAKTILYNDKLRRLFEDFFKRTDTLSLGVCNGCQMLSALRDLIPGADHFPTFVCNRSGRFEARLIMTEVVSSKSVLFDGMTGSKMPVVVAHGEGRVLDMEGAMPTMRYVDNTGNKTEVYPFNPNGSVKGVCGFSNDDGRINIMMPHPERVFLRKQFSWFPKDWQHEYSPWMQIFINARKWFD